MKRRILRVQGKRKKYVITNVNFYNPIQEIQNGKVEPNSHHKEIFNILHFLLLYNAILYSKILEKLLKM